MSCCIPTYSELDIFFNSMAQIMFEEEILLSETLTSERANSLLLIAAENPRGIAIHEDKLRHY